MHELTIYYNRGGELQTVKGRSFDSESGDEQLIPKKAMLFITTANFEMSGVSRIILAHQMRRQREPAQFALTTLLNRCSEAAVAKVLIQILLTPKWRLQLDAVVASLRKRLQRKAVISQ